MGDRHQIQECRQRLEEEGVFDKSRKIVVSAPDEKAELPVLQTDAKLLGMKKKPFIIFSLFMLGKKLYMGFTLSLSMHVYNTYLRLL